MIISRKTTTVNVVLEGPVIELVTLPGYKAWMDANTIFITQPDGKMRTINRHSPLRCSAGGK